MKRKVKQVLSLLLSLATVMSMLSGAVVPAVAAKTSSGKIVLDKTAKLEDDGTYTIDLSGFVTGQSSTSQVTNAVPLDVVLVLDASSSMLKFENSPDTYTAFTAPEGMYPDGDERTTVNPYPADATSTTNLWLGDTGMSRQSQYYDNSKDPKWVSTKGDKTNVLGSITIPVKPGDKIYCSSFRDAADSGAASNGIRVTYFKSNGQFLKGVSPTNVNAEFNAVAEKDMVNGLRYITVPDGAYIMNIPVWRKDGGDGTENKVIYNLSLGAKRYNPVNNLEFEAMRAKVLQAQIDKFADALVTNALETGVTHKLGIVTFGGGDDATGVSKQGYYRKHGGVNGYNGYLFTNTGAFVNGEFINWMTNAVDNQTYPHYTPVFKGELNTENTYYYLDYNEGSFKTVTYDPNTQTWVGEDGTTLNPKAASYDYNSRIQFFTMKLVPNTESNRLVAKHYKQALPSVLNSDNTTINPVVQAAVDRYLARGSTHTKYGLAMADLILQNNSNITTNEAGEVTREAQRVVILFTDGNTNDRDENYKTMFWRSNSIKGRGAKLYTISLTDEEDTSDEMARWMDQISSNVDYKEGYSTLASCTTMFDADAALTGGKYYMDIEDVSELDEIFTTITTDVTTSSTSVELGESAVMQDYLAAGFKLPDDFDFSNITVSTVGLTTEDDVNYSEDLTTKVVFNRPENAGDVNEATGSFYYTYTQGGVTATKTMEVTFNKELGMVSVRGFNYSDHYVAKEHDGRKLSLRITGVEVTDAVATDALVNTNTTTLSGIAYTTATDSGVHPFPVPKTQLAEVTYIMDYAKPMTISSSDWGGDVIGVAGNDRLKINSSVSEYTGTYGTVQKNETAADGSFTVTYTPTEMKWDKPAVFYVLRTLPEAPDSDEEFDEGVDYVPEGVTTGANQWVRVNVIPANNIYYEDDFGGISYNGNWQTVGTPQNSSENPEGKPGDADGIHGWEESLVDKGHSDNDAHIGEVTETVGAAQGKIAEATFTFVGNGVDIYSFTNSQTGTILATLSGSYLEGDETKTLFKAQIADTQSVSGGYYQIPVLSFMDLPYGTYTVTIRVTTAAKDPDRFIYYLDGIRVYNPLADDSAYPVKEQNASFEEVRDLLAMDVAGNQGAVFFDKIDDETGSMKDYDQTEYGLYGPKNEVYLAKNQSITFMVGNGEAYYIGLKCPTGNGAAVAKISNGADTVRQINITHSTDMYYKVLPKDGYITIENVGDGLLSVTKLRIAGENGQVMPIAEEAAVMAVRSFRMMPVVREQEPSCEHSYMGNLCTVCGETLNDVVFQGNSEGTAFRMMTYVGDLADYSKVTFRVTIGSKTTDLTCTKAYTSILAGGKTTTASQIFGEDAKYLAMYTLTGVTEAMYETEITVSVIWTDVNGNETESKARTVKIGDLFDA